MYCDSKPDNANFLYTMQSMSPCMHCVILGTDSCKKFTETVRSHRVLVKHCMCICKEEVHSYLLFSHISEMRSEQASCVK